MKKIVWSKYLRIFHFGDDAYIVTHWGLAILRMHYSPRWGLRGFILQVGQKQIFFSFGDDKHGLHKDFY